VEAQRQTAEAQLVAAREKLRADEARLAQILAGSEPEDIRQAEAGVAQAVQQLAIATTPSTEQDLRAQRAAVEQARLQVERARLPFDSFDVQQQEQAVAQARSTLDGRRNPYTREDLQAAVATVDQARATLELAELSIRDTTVLAPVDGIVAERLTSAGALVTPATPLLSLVPPTMELQVNVEESQLGKVAEGQSVILQVAAYPDETFSGTVSTIAPVIDPKSRTAAVKVIPGDNQGRLRSGMLARLNIVTASRTNVVLLPKDALIGLTGADASVMVIDQDSQARRTPVRVGIVSDRFAEITSGIREGQLVIVGNVAQLTDGDRVTPQMTTQLAYGR
jgi:membrane fusion protein (multidrug efflux system)